VLARREDGDSGEEAPATRIALGDAPPGDRDTGNAIDSTESAQIGPGGAQ